MVEPDWGKIKEGIREIVAEILEVEAAEIKDDSNFKEDLGMDSMKALEIMVALERKFSVKITEDDLKDFSSVNSTMELVKSKYTEQ